ncbi:MAG: ligase-associated DNA damage response endonuclease PdeM [Acidovorax sp.]
MMQGFTPGLDIRIAGQDFTAFAQRALYWPKNGLLMIADLHLGKSDTFRASGISVPYAVQQHDLARLDALLAAVRPRALVVLGDFVHGSLVARQTLQAWQALRQAHGATRFILTRGNHDRSLAAQHGLMDEVLAELCIDGVRMAHEGYEAARGVPGTSHWLHISGHHHPVFRARSWHKALPAMVHDGQRLVLPAFSEFTAGLRIHGPDSQVWVFSSETGTGYEGLVVQVR